MTPFDRSRPNVPPPATPLDDVKAAIDRLDREDRAALRPWILARYDVRGYPCASTFTPAAGEPPATGR